MASTQIQHGFDVVRGEDSVRTQQRLKQALDLLAANVAAAFPNYVSFVALGNNGLGNVRLAPLRDPQTNQIVNRAGKGYKLLLAYNATDATDVQMNFEFRLSAPDQIKQLTATNLSAKTILFLLTS